MDSRKKELKAWTRRKFLQQCGTGIGSVALASLFDDNVFAAETGKPASPFAPKPPHFQPTAKRVIYLGQIGAPSQLDLFDYKPELVRLDGTPIPQSFLEGRRFPFLRDVPNLLASRYEFKQYGQAGVYISEQLPRLTEIVDDITVIKSLHTNEINHVPAQLLLNTGSQGKGAPRWDPGSVTAWGARPPIFPLYCAGVGPGRAVRVTCWEAASRQYQGVQFRSRDPGCFSKPAGIDEELRRAR
jgi:hypothetical protein